MPPSVPPVPEGYHSLTPYIYVDNAAAAIDFYVRVFGATEVMRMDAPGNKIGHAELKLGDSHLMLADEAPDMNALSPKSVGGVPFCLLLYVSDVDATVDRAVKAGATLARPVEDKFYGDRSGMITDPFGHAWAISTHKEDVAPEEMTRRMDAMAEKSKSAGA